MKAIVGAGFAIFATLLVVTGIATAQPANMGCSPDNPASTSQTLRCEGGFTIIAEDGARFTLLDRDGNGRVDSVELSGKALLLEVPKKPGGSHFEVMTPQAIAAVRGTKWAVDAAEGKTSVFVVNGRVAVGRRAGSHSVTLGSGSKPVHITPDEAVSREALDTGADPVAQTLVRLLAAQLSTSR